MFTHQVTPSPMMAFSFLLCSSPRLSLSLGGLTLLVAFVLALHSALQHFQLLAM